MNDFECSSELNWMNFKNQNEWNLRLELNKTSWDNEWNLELGMNEIRDWNLTINNEIE